MISVNTIIYEFKSLGNKIHDYVMMNKQNKQKYCTSYCNYCTFCLLPPCNSKNAVGAWLRVCAPKTHACAVHLLMRNVKKMIKMK